MVAGEQASYSRRKRYFKKNGEIVWIKLVSSAIRGETGQIDYFVSVFEDITQAVRADVASREMSKSIVHSSSRPMTPS